MWTSYAAPSSIDDALNLLAAQAPNVRLIAGGTDLLIEFELGVRPPCGLIDLSRVPGLNAISIEPDRIRIGATVTHADIVADRRLRDCAAPLVQACRHIGAPQIRNRATVAGNLVTASPANDTIPALIALDANVTLRSASGTRTLALRDFYLGVRKTVLRPDEMVTGIDFRPLQGAAGKGAGEYGAFVKLGLRAAQAISVISAAATVRLDDHGRVLSARIALGAVTPTIVRVPAAEAALVGHPLDDAHLAAAAELCRATATPITDVRATADYRRDMTGVMVVRALRAIRERAALRSPEVDDDPALLWTAGTSNASDSTRINHNPVDLAGVSGKSLLRALREDVGLTGTKEGCGEGECGACAVLLDGRVVNSCLVPVERARGADIVTIEGVAALAEPTADGMHPLQRAFIDAGAAQCGYCTPGLIVTGAALLNERVEVSKDVIKEGISGNLCRCTGYYKIIEAFEKAARQLA